MDVPHWALGDIAEPLGDKGKVTHSGVSTPTGGGVVKGSLAEGGGKPDPKVTVQGLPTVTSMGV